MSRRGAVGDRPAAWLSRADLAAELSVAESTIDTLVQRAVIPRPVRLTPGCVRWNWQAVSMALASLDPSSNDGASDPYMEGARRATEKTTEGSRGTA